jgi:hypothetical protein
MREALEPFAKAADVRLCGEWRDDERFGGTDASSRLTFCDLRRARSALEFKGQVPPASPSGELEEIACTARGYTIYREPNGAGGHRYWSDSIGGGVVIWDTCLASTEDLGFAMDYEAKVRGEAGP